MLDSKNDPKVMLAVRVAMKLARRRGAWTGAAASDYIDQAQRWCYFGDHFDLGLEGSVGDTAKALTVVMAAEYMWGQVYNPYVPLVASGDGPWARASRWISLRRRKIHRRWARGRR